MRLIAPPMSNDLLQLQVLDLEVPVLTGIYSEETHLPQPLRISVTVDLDIPTHLGIPQLVKHKLLDR